MDQVNVLLQVGLVMDGAMALISLMDMI